MICDECAERGLPSHFYGHFFGMGHDHRCPQLSAQEIAVLVKNEIDEHDKTAAKIGGDDVEREKEIGSNQSAGTVET
jgi:hypothetical protein